MADEEESRARKRRGTRESFVFARVMHRIGIASEQDMQEVAEAADAIIADGPGAPGLETAVELRVAIDLERRRRLFQEQDEATAEREGFVPQDWRVPVLALITRSEALGPFLLVSPDQPVLQAQELAATRGDGVFETLGVVDRHPQAVDAHLARFARSAAMLDLPAPDSDAYRAAIAEVASRLPHGEAFVKLVHSRGVEGGSAPTGWVLGGPAVDHTAARTDGIRVAVLDRGLRHDVAATAPWLLQGAKTLSYAVNMAALREARRRDADDALFVSSDGVLLEGPTSNLVLRRGDRLLTPATHLGILAGTTQADAFRFAEGLGMTTAEEVLPRSALDDADGLWLLSSLRLAAPVREVDGEAREVDAAFTAQLNAHLLGRRD